jgi:hypothetical protein
MRDFSVGFALYVSEQDISNSPVTMLYRQWRPFKAQNVKLGSDCETYEKRFYDGQCSVNLKPVALGGACSFGRRRKNHSLWGNPSTSVFLCHYHSTYALYLFSSVIELHQLGN